jgi:hypothetical protein
MELNTLIAKRAFGEAQAKDFSDWAENLLIQGCDSENVAILASFGIERFPNLTEVENYFEKCVDELGLVLPEDQIAIHEYAKYLAAIISTGILEPTVGLELLKDFWRLSGDYDEPIYRIWEELADDICTLDDCHFYLWNTGLSKNNRDEFIIQVAKQFIQLCDSELPDDFFHLCVCNECGYIGKPQFKQIDLPWLPEKLFRLIYRKSPTFQWLCGQCAKAGLKNMFDYAGRKQYLESQSANKGQ